MSDSNPLHPRPDRPADSEENIGQEQVQAMSLLAGAARPEGLPQADDADFAGVDEGGGASISQSTILVVVVLAIAVGSLYAMRLTQGKITADGDSRIEAKIEETLTKWSHPETMSAENPLHPDQIRSLFKGTEQIVATLEIDLRGRQVPPDQIQKNPFQLTIDKKPVTADDGSDREIQAQLERLQRELKQIKLQGVMGRNNKPIAMIDGDFYQDGQAVGSFRIVGIDTDRSVVKLSAAGHSFTLTMAD